DQVDRGGQDALQVDAGGEHLDDPVESSVLLLGHVQRLGIPRICHPWVPLSSGSGPIRVRVGANSGPMVHQGTRRITVAPSGRKSATLALVGGGAGPISL